MAKHWFSIIRSRGSDVRELLHDGHPTACVGDAAFAYVNAFKEHVNVGFFCGPELADPEGLLEGIGKFMRHVTLKPQGRINVSAVEQLIDAAYKKIKSRAQRAQDAV
jgi:hypothetical protein